MKSAIQFLQEWAGQESWKVHVINKITTKTEVNIPELLKEILSLIDSKKSIDIVIESKDVTVENVRLVIQDIKSPRNINALSNDSNFSLGGNLNVFYGENGAGKSSYVRMFRKLADNYLTSEKDLTIFPNVYDKDKIAGIPSQTVEVKYLIDNIEKNEIIDMNIEHPDLCKLNVFDSESVVPLIDDDISFSILPIGFDYFQATSNLLDELRVEISSLINLESKQQSLLFTDSSFDSIRADIEVIIKEVTNKADVKSFLDINYPRSKSYNEELNFIDLRISELESSNPSDKLKILSAQKIKLQTIKESFDKLSTLLSLENISEANELINEYAQKLEEEMEYNKKFKENVSYLEVINDEWISLIQSAKQYYESTETIKATLNEPCVFCSQPLDSNAVNLINNNFSYISKGNSTLIQAIEHKIQKHSICLSLNQISEEDATFFESEKLLDRIKTSIQLVNRNKDLFNKLLSSKEMLSDQVVLDLSDITDEISKEVESLQNRMDSIQAKNGDIVKLIAPLKSQAVSLKNNEKLHCSLDLLLDWFDRQHCIESYKSVKKRFSTNKLTQKQSEAFKAIVHGEYIETFKHFSEKLKVPFVELRTTPKKGKTLRNKYVSSEEYKVSQVLSEGEQKAVAVAEFATDLTMRKDYNPLLFDDPVNSLDYKRTELIASLIHELSNERQVIVFTHNIMFYYNLYNASRRIKKSTDKFFKVDEIDKMNKGFVSESFTGRLENLKEITNKLNEHNQTINSKSCFGDALEDHLKKAYSDIRTWCELIVEEGFLKSIIRRYEPNIMFSSVRSIDGTFVDELEAVSNLFDKSCRWMAGHSQPIESQHVRANKEAFNEDFKYILTLNNQYKKS
ncbi:AAA family ATPase [Sporosarcina sp. BI001-red]|uniref:AAA family ATPase n=1 Tax=Sporosarcina sp. BI001-red TaxID=2282866 RepID=UPI0013143D3C|nr:AAA family ATPase [Sporosarcina sp. BI001-red]